MVALKTQDSLGQSRADLSWELKGLQANCWRLWRKPLPGRPEFWSTRFSISSSVCTHNSRLTMQSLHPVSLCSHSAALNLTLSPGNPHHHHHHHPTHPDLPWKIQKHRLWWLMHTQKYNAVGKTFNTPRFSDWLYIPDVRLILMSPGRQRGLARR